MDIDTKDDSISFEHSDDEYKYLIGNFIHECNILEDTIISNILGHYVDVERLDLIGEFSEYFISPANFTFQTSITVFKKILNKHHSDFREKNKDLLKDSNFSKIVLLRNILAHSTQVLGMFDDNNEYFHLHWFSREDSLKAYGIDEYYCFKVRKSEFKEYLQKTIDIHEVLLSHHFKVNLSRLIRPN